VKGEIPSVSLNFNASGAKNGILQQVLRTCVLFFVKRRTHFFPPVFSRESFTNLLLCRQGRKAFSRWTKQSNEPIVVIRRRRRVVQGDCRLFEAKSNVKKRSFPTRAAEKKGTDMKPGRVSEKDALFGHHDDSVFCHLFSVDMPMYLPIVS
jgi:hypothetical protein